MNEQIDRYFEWMAKIPSHSYLIAGSIILFWLIGVVCGWKWTYEPSTWGWRLIHKTFGERAVRICHGILLLIALACVTYLYFYTK